VQLYVRPGSKLLQLLDAFLTLDDWLILIHKPVSQLLSIQNKMIL